MRRNILMIISLLLSINLYAIEGALSVKFSVSEDKQVQFSKGNLQYKASTDTWRFAENQYDYIGETNKNISSTYEGWIDLFGWGTGDNPVNTSTNYENYGFFSDWGINSISNGGNTSNQWYTLSCDEWTYLLGRYYPKGYDGRLYLCCFATVNDVRGVILLPDNWSIPNGISFTYNIVYDRYESINPDWDTNKYSGSEWVQLENSGVVFLPAAGIRVGREVGGFNEAGGYWTSTHKSSYNCNIFGFQIMSYYYIFGASYWEFAHYARSVRLVKEYDGTQTQFESSISSSSCELQTKKIISNGQLLILKNGKTFNALGAEIK